MRQKLIDQNKLDNELLFNWFAMYMADDKIKNKVYLTDPDVLEWVKNVDSIIKAYIQKKKITIKYVYQEEFNSDYVWIFKNKKLILPLEVEKFLI